MRSTKAVLTILMMTVVALAGCAGDEETKAAFVATPLNGDKTAYKFDGSPSTGSGLTYSWDFGDRSEPATSTVVEHTYEFPNGEYTVTLTIKDEAGATETFTQAVPVGSGSNTSPLLYLTVDKRRASPNDPILFDASQSYDPDGDPLFFEWDFNSQLSDQEWNNMENLGGHAYGRYQYGPPPGGGVDPNSTDPNATGDEPGLTNSGHDWQDEVAEAYARLQESAPLPPLGFHGGAAGAAEPRNTAFDGRVNDTGPIQFFQYDSNAVYYVHVRVEDIKGDSAEGFVKISIEDGVPPSMNSTPFTGPPLLPTALGPLGTGAQDDARTSRPHEFTYPFPAVTTVKIEYTSVPEGAPNKVNVYACAKDADLANCKSAPIKMENVQSGATMVYKAGPDKTYPLTTRFYVENADNSQVDYTLTLDSIYDLNPWFSTDAGYGGHH